MPSGITHQSDHMPLWSALRTARRARRDDLHRAVDAGDPVELRPIVIVDVGIADEKSPTTIDVLTTFTKFSGVLARLSRARNSLLWIKVKIFSANGRSSSSGVSASYPRCSRRGRGLVAVQPEPAQRPRTGDAVDYQPGAALEFPDDGGGARPVDAVDHKVGVQRIIAVQPGLQEPDKIVAVAGPQDNCHEIDVTPNHVQL